MRNQPLFCAKTQAVPTANQTLCPPQCIGTNHVLPTRKAARYTGGLWVGKYLRTVTYQEVTSTEASGELGRLCGRASRAENFEAHARSGDLRAHLNLKDKIEWISQSGYDK